MTVGQSNHEAECDAYVMHLSCMCPDLSCLGLACHANATLLESLESLESFWPSQTSPLHPADYIIYINILRQLKPETESLRP